VLNVWWRKQKRNEVVKIKKLKICNAYCGIGGNRKLIPDEITLHGVTYKIEVTAVENNVEIAEVYKKLFPQDKVIVGDAHEYLLKHFKEFDFIWSSPPCQSHTKLRVSHPESIIYPDMRLYQEIILLQQWFKGKFCVENVEPYYVELKKPSIILDRHYFWTNFELKGYDMPKAKKDVSRDTYSGLSKYKGINLMDNSIKNKRLLLRNAVHPKLGLHIFECAFKIKQQTLN